jgi:predicted nucleic acid-binding protein
MIVVADSGPLHYLILLEHIELLRRFYGQVLVPEPVASELSAAGAPDVVREAANLGRCASGATRRCVDDYGRSGSR